MNGCFKISGSSCKIRLGTNIVSPYIVSAAIVSVLVPIGSNGKIYWGIIYIVQDSSVITTIPYAFIFMSIYFAYKNLKNLGTVKSLGTITYLYGYYMSLISAILLTYGKNIDTYLSFFIDAFLILLGYSMVQFRSGIGSKLKFLLKQRDFADKFIVMLAFLIVAASKLFSKNMSSAFALTFLILSWITFLIVFRDVFKVIASTRFEVFYGNIALLSLINLGYFVLAMMIA